MFRVKVDRAEPIDLHEQVAGEIRRAIAEGEAKVGERLPPARDLAAVLDRGRGITVAATPDHGAVVVQARDLVRLARKHGYRLDELVRIIESVD
jgi:GntR family transcriptional regulator